MGDLAYEDDDVLNWRNETVDGKIYMMAPPALNHQRVSRNISHIFEDYFKGKKCVPFSDGVYVHLTAKDKFAPDAMIVCNRDLIRPDGVHGAPELVVEILSPSTAKRDKVYKKDVYEKCGVKEYWIVNVDSRSIEVFLLKENKFVPDEIYSIYEDFELERLTDNERLDVKYEFTPSMFPELVINIEDVFSGMFKF